MSGNSVTHVTWTMPREDALDLLGWLRHNRPIGMPDRTFDGLLDALTPAPAAPPERRVVDGRTDPCPAPGYRLHTAVGAGAISSPYLCHGCSTWFTLPETSVAPAVECPGVEGCLDPAGCGAPDVCSADEVGR